MTNQEAFDIMCEHLMTQGCKAEDNDGNCRYRTDDGKMCPVGALIPDDRYRAALENATPRDLCDKHEPAYFVLEMEGLNSIILQRVQSIHDNSPVEEWPVWLVSVAEDFNLAGPACIQP